MRPHIRIDIPSLTTVGARLQFESAQNEVNVSNAQEIVIEESKSNVKGFQLDLSSLDGSYSLFPASGYNGYLGKASSAIITMKVVSVSPATVVIVFDRTSNAYAETIEIEVVGDSSAPNYGRTITIENNNQVELSLDITSLELTDQQLVQFTFSDWSVEDASIKIEQLSANYLLDYTGDIISFVCSENLMDSDLRISPGICEQYADVEIYDRSGILRRLGLQGKLHEDEVLYISVLDDYNNELSLGTWYVSEWSIDATKSRIKIKCRDVMYRLSSININKTPVQDRTVNDLLNLVFSQAPGFNWMYLDTDTESRCNQIVVPNNWYLETDLKTVLNKICGLGMLRIYWYNEMFYIGRSV